MPQKVKETKHTVQDNGLQTVSRFMQVFFAIVQILLVFRFAFKLLGANASNVFVNLIYATTAPLVGLFEGIFSEVNLEGGTFAVFEPAAVIAIVVTAAVSYIVFRLLSVKQDKKVEHVEVKEQANPIPLGQVSEARVTQASEKPAPQASENPVPRTSETPEAQTSETPEVRTSETPAARTSETPAARTSERRMAQASETRLQAWERRVAQTSHNKLENQSRELEERIQHQKQTLEEQEKMYDAVHDENELEADPNNSSHEVPVYEKRKRQI